MPRRDAERLAESFLRQLAPEIVGMLDAAIAEQDEHASGPDGAGAGEDEERYVSERAAKQLARYRGKAARPRSVASASPRRRKGSNR